MVLPLGVWVACPEGAITVLINRVSRKLIGVWVDPASQVITVCLAGQETIIVKVFFTCSKKAVAVVVLSITYLWCKWVDTRIAVVAVVVRAIAIAISVLVRWAITIRTAGIWRAITIRTSGARRTITVRAGGIRRRTIAVRAGRIRRRTIAIGAAGIRQRTITVRAGGIRRRTIAVRAGRIVGARDPRRKPADHNEKKRGHGNCQDCLHLPMPSFWQLTQEVGILFAARCP
jgi:hypothetical protein